MGDIGGLRRAQSLALVVIVAFTLGLNVMAQAGKQVQVQARGSSAVGVLLLQGQHPFCTASIVNSPRGNLIITAAHCLGRKLASTLMFAPYYDDESAPLGEWQVTGQVFPPGWFHGDVNQDFAFLIVRGDVQARAGAESLGFSLPVPASVRVEAYSLVGRLTICERRPGVIAVAGQHQLSFACPGYAKASSGGPFLTDIDQQSGLGTIVGVIGGYQHGGSTSSMSYSSPFGGVLHKLYGSMTRVNADPGSEGLAALLATLGGNLAQHDR
jgi:hypothetical protein